jgi:hypothetical protein
MNSKLCTETQLVKLVHCDHVYTGQKILNDCEDLRLKVGVVGALAGLRRMS